MKKLRFMTASAALTALMLTACQNTEDFSQESLQGATQALSDEAVQFGTYVGRDTRATGGATGDITTTSLKTGAHNAGFGVVAYHTNTEDWAGSSNPTVPNFMWNQKVAWNSTNSTWSYTPVKYWPNDFSTTNVDNKEGVDESKNAWGSQNGGKVSFFAYAPYVNFATSSTTYKEKTASQESTAATDGITALTANSVTGEPQVYYILDKADINNAVDLLWGLRGNSSGYNLATNSTDGTSVADYNVNLTKQSVTEKVNFLFKHALSKVGGHTESTATTGKQTGLQVVLDIDDGSYDGGVKDATAIQGGIKEDGTLVTVKSIEVYDQASANSAGISNLSKTTSDLVKEGWFNIANGTWTLAATPEVGATYTSKVGTGDSGDTGELNAQIKEGNPTYNSSTSKWSISSTEVTGVTTTPQDVYTDDSDVPALLLIPSTTAQTLVVRIKYYVRTYDANLNNGANNDTGDSKTWTKVEQTITNEVTIPANSLKSNTYYKLLIHLGLTSVKFTASVADWEEAAVGGTTGNDNDDPNNDKDIFLPSNTLNTTSVASTEAVNSASVAAGSSKTYTAAAAAGTFTINLTGISSSATALNVVCTGTTATATSTYTGGEATGTVIVTLPENSSASETQTTTVTITAEGAGQTTRVTLVQEETATP